MSRILSEMLGINNLHFQLSLKELERSCGYPAIDIRLSGDITRKVQKYSGQLGLDSNDTNGPELYAMMLATIRQHDISLSRTLGVTNHADTAKLIPAIAQAIVNSEIPRSCWVIKPSVIKRLIKKMPPKNTMKLLGYRSVDSMLKREQICQIYAVMQLIESPLWIHKFKSTYESLNPSDFELASVDIVQLKPKIWQLIKHKSLTLNSNILNFRETGQIVILPMSVQKIPGFAVTFMPMLLQAVQDARVFSAFIKLSQVRPDFGATLTNAVLLGNAAVAQFAGQPMYWSVLHHYISRNAEDNMMLFEPHLQVDDMSLISVAEVMKDLVPDMKLWHGMEYCGLAQNSKVTSCNVIDVAINYCNQLPYENQSSFYMQNALWHEFYERYLSQGDAAAQVIQQLDNDCIEELLTVEN